MVKRSPDTSVIVGHVPRLILVLCSIFIYQGGFIVCVVTLLMHVQNFLSGSREFTKMEVGKILANDIQFTKFAKVFPCQNFALYSLLSRTYLKVGFGGA